MRSSKFMLPNRDTEFLMPNINRHFFSMILTNIDKFLLAQVDTLSSNAIAL